MTIQSVTIGREREREIIMRNVMQRHHTLLYGRSGIGKTHLLVDLQRRLADKRDFAYHFLIKPSPPKDVAEGVYLWLTRVAGVAKLYRITAQTRISDINRLITEILVLPQMVDRQLVLLVDDFDAVSLLSLPVFEIVMDRATVVAASRIKQKGARFSKLFWRFNEVPIMPLGKQDARELARHVFNQVEGVRPPEPAVLDFLLNQVTTLSSGVPSAICESIERLRGATRIDRDFVRDMFVHRSGNTYFDASPLLLCFVAFLVVMRYINRGMYQFDMYAIFGALSGMVLLLRWFMSTTSRDKVRA